MAHSRAVGTMAVLLAIGGAAPAAGQSEIYRGQPVLQRTDVAPDAAYGEVSDSFAAQAGRVVALVVDPTADEILYAGTEKAGVWKSIDAGVTWWQASGGLAFGITADIQSLAVDAVHSQRLLYATADDDGRLAPLGGLWVSDDAARSWSHVPTLCPTQAASITSVAFAGGRPFVSASCGLFTTADATLATARWTAVATPFAAHSFGPPLVSRNLASGDALFACDGATIYRSLDLGQRWEQGPTLNGGCFHALAVAPLVEPAPSTVLVSHSTPTGTEITLVRFAPDGNTTRDLGFAHTSTPYGSGDRGVFAARIRSAPPGETTPGLAYDVYASSSCDFFRYAIGSDLQPDTWFKVGALRDQGGCNALDTLIHVDPWAMAFPSTYDPPNHVCTAFAATDGGVFENDSSAPGFFGFGCSPLDGWVKAQSGLHVMQTGWISGAPQSPDVCGPGCPALYLPTGDNDIWTSRSGGQPGWSWSYLGWNLGDAARVYLDPLHPTAALGSRGGGGCKLSMLRSADGNPPGAGNATGAPFCVEPPAWYWGINPPGTAGVVQELRLATEAAEGGDVYVAVQSRARFCSGAATDPACSAPDALITALSPSDGTSWVPMEPNPFFGPAQIAGLAASGGLAAPSIWALTAHDATYPPGSAVQAGQVHRANLSGGYVRSWTPASSGLVDAYALFAHPYAPGMLWALDLGAGDVKTSRDGGATWTRDVELTNLATGSGAFRLDCGFPAKPTGGQRPAPFSNTCSLSDMSFDPFHPGIAVAALTPAGLAFTRDFGKHWIALGTDIAGPALGEPEQLPEVATSVWYDFQPNAAGQPSLYVGSDGHSIFRLDGPFPSLQDGRIAYCPLCGNLPSLGGRRVRLVLDATGWSFPIGLRGDAPGVGRALFDGAGLEVLRYHFVVGDEASATFRHRLTPAERAGGWSSLSNASTELRYRGPHALAAGRPTRLAARLTDEADQPIAGRRVTFSLGGELLCAGTTDGRGLADCLAPPPHLPAGRARLAVRFAGDAFFPAEREVPVEVGCGRGPGPRRRACERTGDDQEEEDRR